MLLSRPEWSQERGYERFLRDAAVGIRRFVFFMEVGQIYRIQPSAPDILRRFKGGMLISIEKGR